MPFLLLARGDKEGKELLRRALEARYGVGAPAIDTLKIEFKGRKRARLGPVATWVPVDGECYFNAPLCGRFEHTARAAGLPLNTMTDAFDSAIYRKRRSRESVEVVTDADLAMSMQRRLWAASALLLTPLVEHFVELRATGERSFDATNLETDDTVSVFLNDDFTIDYVTAECYNPSEEETQRFVLKLSEGQEVVDELMLPRKLTALWEDNPEMELTPVAVTLNPQIDAEMFRLED